MVHIFRAYQLLPSCLIIQGLLRGVCIKIKSETVPYYKVGQRKVNLTGLQVPSAQVSNEPNVECSATLVGSRRNTSISIVLMRNASSDFNYYLVCILNLHV